MFFRPCGWCGAPFDYCGSCQPGRRYCGEACSEAARIESTQRAHTKYNARDTAEGLEAHRREEAERRGRLALKRVGDQRCAVKPNGLQLASLTVHAVVTETSDAILVPPSSPSDLDLGELVGLDPQRQPAQCVEWVLVAWPELYAAARERQGTEATCSFCGRRGHIVRVVSLHYWRRRLRHGFG